MGLDPFHSVKPWESPELCGEGMLPMRSPLLPYPSAEAALAAAVAGPRGSAHVGRGPSAAASGEADTPWRLGLDGSWRFALVPNPEAVPRGSNRGPGFAEEGFDDAPWASLRVPGSWTLQGFDKPHYTNVVMPFGNVPPSAPAEHNPTGLYRVRFELPSGWEGRRVVLHVGGAESFLEAWCNGSRLGFSKDTRLPSEFDITPFMTAGSNLLAFMVIRYSDSSYVEDQDQWWYGGIYRSVYLYSTDFAYIADLDARPKLSDDLESGEVEVAVKLGFTYDPSSPATGLVAGDVAASDMVTASGAEAAPPMRTAFVAGDYSSPAGLLAGALGAAYYGDWRVRVALYGPVAAAEGAAAVRGEGRGAKVASAEASVDARYRLSRWEARLSLPVVEPRKWSHEDPALYTLVISLVSPDGREVEHAACSLGFRRVEVRDRSLLINGERVLIKGVNRHEHDERMGKTLELEDMIRDIEIMKRHNFNAVRLAHYPNDERWYELCDRYGLYLIDEANIESHAYYDHLCRDPRWAQAFLERGVRMVLRDKPSLGDHLVARQRVGLRPEPRRARRLDTLLRPDSPIHYEGAMRPEWGQGAHDIESVKRGKAASDIVSTMYPPLSLLEEWSETTVDDRPFIMCEYSHAMGNSNGGLSDYWALIESRKGLQGGFIWDWVDQGIEAFDETGKKYWKYGGDFGDAPSDLDFICNGLVFPDRSEKPVLAECAKLFQDIAASSEHPATGRVRIRNKGYFTSLEGVVMRWAIQVEGEPLLAGELPLPAIAPGASAELDLAVPWTDDARSRVAFGESFLFLEFVLGEPKAWAPAGHRLAWEQLPLSTEAGTARAARPTGASTSSRASRATRSPAALAPELAPEAGGYRIVAPKNSAGYEAVISGAGFLASLSSSRGKLLASPLAMNLWRAPTENDGLKMFMELRGIPDFEWYCKGKAMYEWLDTGLDALSFSLSELSRATDSPRVHIVHEATSRTGKRVGRFVQDLNFGAESIDGSFLFDLDPRLPELPKIGLACSLAPGLEKAKWYGRGPQECYSDRKAGAAWACTRRPSTSSACPTSCRRRTATAPMSAGSSCRPAPKGRSSATARRR